MQLSQQSGLSAGTIITKETKKPKNRALLGALLFGYMVSFVVCNLYLGDYIRSLTRGPARVNSDKQQGPKSSDSA